MLLVIKVFFESVNWLRPDSNPKGKHIREMKNHKKVIQFRSNRLTNFSGARVNDISSFPVIFSES